jgi:ketosteroid isomerase-like protein
MQEEKMTRSGLAGLAAAIVLAGAVPVAAQQSDAVSKDSPFAEMAKQWQDDYNRNDIAAVAALYAGNAVWVFPDGIVRGRANIEQDISKRQKAGWVDVSISDEGDHAEGNLAWSVGKWSGHIRGQNGAETPIGGFWSVLFVRQGSGWKIQEHTTNVTLPPPQPAQR